MPRHLLGAAAALAAALALAAPAGAATFGSPGLGDPFFPLAGNGGYDVGHYALALDYDRAGNRLAGTTTITATATQALDRFDLDLRGFAISRLDVNGAPATFTRDGQELQITPRSHLVAGKAFTVRVDYAGTPAVVTDPDGSIEGWIPTADGAIVVNEPQGTPAWFPVNDNPRDKATYDFSITVPEGITALANGVLRSSATRGGKTTWVWRESSPMAPYLATATNGRFNLYTQTGPNGLPIYNAIDAKADSAKARSLALQGARDRVVLQRSLRRVPVRGGRRDHRPAARRRLLARGADQADLRVRARRDHGRPRALAHVVRRRRDGQGVARPVAARGVRHVLRVDLDRAPRRPDGTAGVRQALRGQRSSRGARRPNALERPSQLFSTPVYDRGGMTLQALRVKVGDAGVLPDPARLVRAEPLQAT